jgi:hypothetical protein
MFESQHDAILAALKRGSRITPLNALRDYGCMRLAARIDDLRNEGYQIDTRIESANGKRFASYKLAAPPLVQGEMFARLVTR